MRLTSFGRSTLGPIACTKYCTLSRALRILWLTRGTWRVSFGLWWGFWLPRFDGTSTLIGVLPRGVVMADGRFLLVWWP